VVADPADWTQILKGHISDSRKRPDSQEKWIAGTSESELSEASHLLLKKNPRKKNVQTVSVLDHRERRAAAKKGTQTSVRRKRSENQERAAKDVGKIIELRYPWPGSEPLAVAELTEIYDAALPAGDDLVAIRTKLFDNLEIWMKLWKQQPDAWIPSLDQWLHDGTWKREPTERERNRAQKGAQREKRSQLQQGLYGGDDGKS
jgi:hypothetical protein